MHYTVSRYFLFLEKTFLDNNNVYQNSHCRMFCRYERRDFERQDRREYESREFYDRRGRGHGHGHGQMNRGAPGRGGPRRRFFTQFGVIRSSFW